jgi:hypothetical protein
MFAGIPQNCNFGGSASGCVMSFDITSAFPTTAMGTGDTPGGSSGMVVDNVSTDGHASSLYYSTLSTATSTTPTGASGAGGCAVPADAIVRRFDLRLTTLAIFANSEILRLRIIV